MEETVKKDILAVLGEAVKILQQTHPDALTLKQLSNHTIHNASIFQDENSISTAILIYSLSKVIERVKNRFDYSKIINLLNLSIEYLNADNIESYQNFIKQIFTIISSTDSKFKRYIQEAIKQASIRKGSRIYEHGISASKTAEILGLSLWEFYDYLGATNIADIDAGIVSVRERLRFARSLFL